MKQNLHTLKTAARLFALAATLLFGALGASAQTPVTITIGTGTAQSNIPPFGNTQAQAWTQSIYTADNFSAIPAGGTITAIAYECKRVHSGFDAPEITIYMGHTDKSVSASMSDWVPMTDLTQVYKGYDAQPFTTGWNTINLNTPFLYNGTDNLVICIFRNGTVNASQQQYAYTNLTGKLGTFMVKNAATGHPGTATANTRNFMLPNIKLTVTPTAACYPPADLVRGAYNRTSASFSWTAPEGAPMGYVAKYKMRGSSVASMVSTATPSVTLSGLTSGQHYDLEVYTVCSPGDTSNLFVSTSFVTDCAPQDLPFYDNFASTPSYTSFSPENDLPLCWRFLGLATAAGSYPQAYVFSDGSLRLTCRGTDPLYVILPAINADLETTTLSFTTTITSDLQMTYGYMLDPTDAASYKELGTITSAGTYAFDLSEDYELIPYGSRLAFRLISSAAVSRTVYLNQVSLEQTPNCIAPVRIIPDLMHSNVRSVQFTWEGVQNPGDTFRVRRKRTDLDDTILLAQGLTVQSYIDTGLTEGRSYEYFVDKNCGGDYTRYASRVITLLGTVGMTSNDEERGYVVGDTSGVNSAFGYFHAVARPNYHFQRWDDGNTDNPRRVLYSIADFASSYVAQFDPDTFNISVNAINPLFGSVSAHTGRHAYGSLLNLTATPNEGYKFIGWSDGTSTPEYTYTVRRDASLIAYFCPEDQTMILGTLNDPLLGTITTSPAGGVVSPGQTVTITATVNDPDHYTFRFNPEVGTATSSGNTHTLILTAGTESMIIAGIIEPAKFDITIEEVDSLVGTTYGAGSYEYGSRVPVVARASNHAIFVQWRGSAFTNANPYTVTVNGDKHLIPVFLRDSVTIALQPSYADRGTVAFPDHPGVTSVRVAVGDSITITTTALEHYTFHSWSNGITSATQTVVAVGADGSTRTYTAHFQPDMHTISVLSADTAMGSTDGSASYGYGTVAYLEAIPNPGYLFLRWNDGSTDNPYRPTVTGDKSYTAHFTSAPVAITATPDDATHGTATVSGQQVYRGTVTLTADTLPGWSFANWTNAHGTVVSTDRAFSFQAVSDSAFTANYTQTLYTVTVTATPGMGLITPNVSGTYHYGDVITTAAAPYDPALYEFAYWSIDGSTNPTLTWTVTSNADIVANFIELGDFVVNLTVNNPAWGTAYTDKPSYDLNDRAILTADPAEHYEFVGWNDGNTRNHRVMTMQGDSTLQAIFAPKTYTLNALSADNTKGYVDGSGRYPYDTIVTLTATPLAGQHVSGWIGANGTLPTVNVRIAGDTTVTALFATSNMPVTVTGINATTTGSGLYPYGSTVTISATPDANYRFTQWNDGNVINPRTIVVDSTSNYVAFTEAAQCTITVVANDPLLGRVAGGDIRPFGSRSTRIEAFANAHCRFLRWDDGETAASRIVAFDASRTYTAIFARDSFELRLAAADATLGSVNTEVNGTYIYDSRVEVRATANPGVNFTQWSDGNSDNPRILTLTADVLDLAAQFDSVAYTLDTATNDNLMGHLVLSPAKPTYRYGETVTVSYVNRDANLYRFVGWENASADASRTLTVEGDLYIRAIFTEADKYTVSALSGNPAMGTTLGSATSAANGSTHTLIARPAAHCHFLGWSDGNTDTLRIVTVSGADIVLVANFAADTHTVAFAAAAGGTLAGNGRYAYGSVVTLYATPADHYHFVQWSDGVTANPRQITVASDATLGATFAIDSVTISVVADHAATVIGAGTYAYNSNVSLRVTPEVNYHFTGWTLDGAQVSSNMNLPAFRATESATYVATFAIDSVSLTVNVNSREYGYVNGVAMGETVRLPYGSTVNLEAVALSHRTFSEWSDGETAASYSLTLTSNTTLTAIFTVDSFTVNIVSADLSMGTVNNAAVAARRYAYGELVTLEATPEYGFEFLYWTPGNIAANPLNQQVVSNHVYTAHFVAQQLHVYAQSADETMGTVAVAPVRNTYTYNEAITVTATPAPHHHFVQWSDGSTDAVRTFNVTRDTLLVATFAIDTVRLTLATNDAAMGSVSGAGVYDWNSNVTIYATASEGYHFMSWNDGNGDNPRQLTLTAATTLTATFAADTHYATVSVVSNNSQWGTATASESRVITGSAVTLTATAAEHYHFVQWSDGVTDAVRTLTVARDTLLTATFAIDTVTLTLAANDAAMGSVSGAGDYAWNSSVTIYATAGDGYHFTGWSDGVSDNPRQLTLTAATTLTALFAADIIVPDSVQINAFAINGTVTGAGLYEVGEEVTLIATAVDTTFIFSNWVKNGSAIDGNDTLTFTADTAASFVAIFIPDTTTIIVPDSVLITAFAIGGTVTGAGLYEVGEEVTLIATAADTTFIFSNWVKNGRAIDGNDTLTFTADSAATYVALFEAIVTPIVIDSFTLTVLSADEAMGTVSGSGYYETRSLVSVTATPATGYRFIGWSDGVSEASRLVYVTSDTTLTANFEIIRLQVTLTGDHAMLRGEGFYDYGSVVTISATPESGYEFVRWVDATGATVSTEASHSFTITSDMDFIAVVRGVALVVSGEASPAEAGFINGLGTYRYGDTVTISAQAHEGYRFTGWTLPWYVQETEAHYTFIIYESIHVIANFAEVGIDDVDGTDVTVYATGNRIHVLGAEGSQVRVFDAVGRLVNTVDARSAEVEIAAPAAGIYMVQVGNAPAKRVAVMR